MRFTVDDNNERLTRPRTWAAIGRVVVKAAVLFILINLLFAAVRPMEFLGNLSLYNWLLEGRDRLPYGENTAESYNLSLNNLPAMMSSHKVASPMASDEFRVVVIGDSGTWGWLLENEDTLAGQINKGDYQTDDGRRIVAYNLGYPIMALSKDLLILDAALAYEPDLIIWPVTLESFPRDQQLVPPLVQRNPGRIRSLISEFNLALDKNDPEMADLNFLEETMVGRRRDLADLLRLQLTGFSWDATSVDQAYPEEITLRRSDFEEDLSWGEFENPVQLTEEELAIDLLAAGVTLSGDVPVLIINEPIFISEGENSDLRYNAWYPRWAYDQYRELLAETAGDLGWHYIDLWDSVSAGDFTDSPVHLNQSGTADFAKLIQPHIVSIVNDN
jgi:lysophospholipase L1-like esterase